MHTPSQCDMRYFFMRGKTHDLYGLLVLIIMSIITLAMQCHTSWDKVFAIVSLVVGVGVFVDLWSHCFHH